MKYLSKHTFPTYKVTMNCTWAGFKVRATHEIFSSSLSGYLAAKCTHYTT